MNIWRQKHSSTDGFVIKCFQLYGQPSLFRYLKLPDSNLRKEERKKVRRFGCPPRGKPGTDPRGAEKIHLGRNQSSDDEAAVSVLRGLMRARTITVIN